MEVHVTQDHIDRGGKGDGLGFCIIERALTEAGFRDVIVGSRCALWSIENLPKQDGYTGRNLVWALPLKVRMFITAVDAGQHLAIEPFTFTVPPKFSPIPNGGTP